MRKEEGEEKISHLLMFDAHVLSFSLLYLMIYDSYDFIECIIRMICLLSSNRKFWGKNP